MGPLVRALRQTNLRTRRAELGGKWDPKSDPESDPKSDPESDPESDPKGGLAGRRSKCYVWDLGFRASSR